MRQALAYIDMRHRMDACRQCRCRHLLYDSDHLAALRWVRARAQ
ncbi:MAG: hypothetical protein AAGN64_01635 [Bacteroidota bacterium]